jgi:hypothetical protein
MALNDRFRIDELLKKGSKAIKRDYSDGIVVRKKDGKEVNPTSKKIEKPFGEEPIRGKQKNPKIKTDLLEPQEEQNVEQTSFSGETASSLERPYYTESELEKALDIKVDELINKPRESRGQFVRLDKLIEQKEINQNLSQQIKDLTQERDAALNQISTLQTQIDQLIADVAAKTEEVLQRDREFRELQARYQVLLSDFQSSVLKGTKEGIERVSLTAQVRGLGAQKETLASQLTTQKDIVKNLTENIKTLNQQMKNQAQIATQQIEAANQQVKAAQSTASSSANSKKKKIICTELYEQGFMPQFIYEMDDKFGDIVLEHKPEVMYGYWIWATPIVNGLKRNKTFAKFVYNYFVKDWSEYMAYEMGVLPTENRRGRKLHKFGEKFSILIYKLFPNQLKKLSWL